MAINKTRSKKYKYNGIFEYHEESYYEITILLTITKLFSDIIS